MADIHEGSDQSKPLFDNQFTNFEQVVEILSLASLVTNKWIWLCDEILPRASGPSVWKFKDTSAGLRRIFDYLGGWALWGRNSKVFLDEYSPIYSKFHPRTPRKLVVYTNPKSWDTPSSFFSCAFFSFHHFSPFQSWFIIFFGNFSEKSPTFSFRFQFSYRLLNRETSNIRQNFQCLLSHLSVNGLVFFASRSQKIVAKLTYCSHWEPQKANIYSPNSQHLLS